MIKRKSNLVFVKYMAKDDMLILVGVSIAHSNEIIKTLNSFYLFILVITIFHYRCMDIVKTITTPLKELSDVADISRLQFKRQK